MYGKVRKKCMAIWTALVLVLVLVLVPMGNGISHIREPMPVSAVEITDASEPFYAQIGTVEVDLEQLKEDHYLVTVPVTIPHNPGFETFQCAAAWDTSQMVVLGSRSTGNGLMSSLMFTDERDYMWMQFLTRNYTDNDLCSITFQISEDVQPGDFLIIQGENLDLNGLPIYSLGSDMQKHPVEVISGGIHIRECVVPDVTVEISDVTIEMDDLEENGYVVEVPIKASVNNGFFGMRFGLSWDASEIQSLPPSTAAESGLSITPIMNASAGEGWVDLFSAGTYRGTDLLTLQFQLSEDVKAGDQFTISMEQVGSNGLDAAVIGSDGTRGTLHLKGGSVTVRSSQPVSSFANGKITLPNIQVTLEELEKSNYQISYPITIVENSAFTELSFGASWNSDEMTAVDCVCDDSANLELEAAYSREHDAIWLPFHYQGAGAAYLKSPLCTVTFQLNRDAAEGDVYEIAAARESFFGMSGEILNSKGSPGMLFLTSGSIQIISNAERDAELGVELSSVEIEESELRFVDNEITIPIMIRQNTRGLSTVSFGVSWDPALAEPVEVRPASNDTFGVQSYFEDTQDAVWIKWISIDPYQDYTFTQQNTVIGYLVLRISDDSKAGDVIPVSMDSVSVQGEIASATTGENLPISPCLVGGTITVTGEISGEDPDGTTAATEWTKPVQTTSTTAVTATEASTESSGFSAKGTTAAETVLSESSLSSDKPNTGTETTAETTVTMQATTSSDAAEEEAHLSHSFMTLRLGERMTLIFYPDSGSAGTYSWDVRDAGMIQLISGNGLASMEIEALQTGVTTISLTCGEEIYRCEITVLEQDENQRGDGDVNLDGELDMADLVLLNQFVAKVSTGLSDTARRNSDLNGDGHLDSKDAVLLLQQLMKI